MKKQAILDFMEDAAVVAVGIVLAYAVIGTAKHFGKPLLASVMGTKKTTTAAPGASSASTASEEPVVTGATQTVG